MAPAARRSVALLLACSAGLGGCSFATVRYPPERMEDPTRKAPACSSLAAPVADLALGAASGVFLASTSDHGELTPGQYLIGAAVIVAFAGSAIYGIDVHRSCREVEELNRKCIRGVQGACVALDPGFKPGPRPPLPLLCSSVAACGPGQRCVQSVCVPAPDPGPAGTAPPPGNRP